MRVIKIFVLILIFLQVNVLSAKTSDVSTMDERLKKLEKSWDLLEESYKNKKDGIDIAFEKEKIEIANELDSLKRTLKSIKQSNKRDSWINYIVLVILIIIPFSTILPWYWNRHKWIKRKIEEELEALFKKELADNRKILMEFIGGQKKEFRYLNESNIVVITPPDKNDDDLVYLLKEWGFAQVETSGIPDKRIENIVDVVIINYANKKLPAKQIESGKNIPDESEIDSMKAMIPENAIVFYLGPDRIQTFNNFKFKAWANTMSQLYGNLMNALYYHDAMSGRRRMD